MRKPSFVIESEKVQELLKRLQPITNWDEVKEGQFIFHNSDNNIHNINKFSEYNKEDNIVWYRTTDNGLSLLYNMSASNWYYYDEYIADQVEEMFTPKLWLINNCLLKVANNEQELYEEMKVINNYNKSFDEFKEDYTIRQIDEVDNYTIE